MIMIVQLQPDSEARVAQPAWLRFHSKTRFVPGKEFQVREGGQEADCRAARWTVGRLSLAAFGGWATVPIPMRVRVWFFLLLCTCLREAHSE